MTWVVALVLLLVVFPVVVVLLNNVLDEANAIVPSIERIRDAARAGSQGPRRRPAAADDAATRSSETVDNVAAYGGSLDVILDDA